MQDPLEWVERARLRWPLNLYKATRRRRSLDDCVHDAFRTVWIFACRRLWEPHLHGCIRLNAVHNILNPNVIETPNTKAGQQHITPPPIHRSELYRYSL